MDSILMIIKTKKLEFFDNSSEKFKRKNDHYLNNFIISLNKIYLLIFYEKCIIMNDVIKKMIQ